MKGLKSRLVWRERQERVREAGAGGKMEIRGRGTGGKEKRGSRAERGGRRRRRRRRRNTKTTTDTLTSAGWRSIESFFK